jgi:YD repeat-containing protein
MRVSLSTLVSGVFLFALSGCFKNESVGPAPCYPTFYRESTGTTSYDESYTYSKDNRVSTIYTNYQSSSSRSSATYEYTYDANGRVTKQVQLSGSTTAYTYTNDKLTGSSVTSSGGQITSKVEYIYNASGQVVTRQSYGLSNGALVKGSYYTYEYPNTSTRNHSKRSLFNSTGVLQSSNVYTYDDKKNPAAVLFVFPTTTTNNVTKYVYTPVGGTAITYTYNYTYADTGYPRSYRLTIGSTTTEFTYDYNNCESF